MRWTCLRWPFLISVDLCGGHLDLEDVVLHVQGLDAALEVGLHLVLVAGVGVHHVPVAGQQPQLGLERADRVLVASASASASVFERPRRLGLALSLDLVGRPRPAPRRRSLERRLGLKLGAGLGQRIGVGNPGHLTGHLIVRLLVWSRARPTLAALQFGIGHDNSFSPLVIPASLRRRPGAPPATPGQRLAQPDRAAAQGAPITAQPASTSAEDLEDQLGKRGVQAGHDADHHQDEDEGHRGVRDEFLAGRPDDLAQFRNDLSQEQQPDVVRSGLAGRPGLAGFSAAVPRI